MLPDDLGLRTQLETGGSRCFDARLEADSEVYYFATWLNNGEIETQLGREGDILVNYQGTGKR